MSADPGVSATLSEAELRADVRAVLAASVPDFTAALEPQLTLVDDLGLDSLGLVELAAELEARYRFDETDADPVSVTTVADLEELVLAATAGRRR